MAAARNTDIPLTQWAKEGKYSQACIKRSPLRQKFKTGDLLKDEYEMFYDWTRKKENFNTGDCSRGDHKDRFDCNITLEVHMTRIT